MKKIIYILGLFLIPIIWLSVKYIFNIEDRFLPSIQSVLSVFGDIEPNIVIHLFYTVIRLWIGFILGCFFGISLGLMTYHSPILHDLFTPTFQSLRSIPSTATIPFFLLWFGFSEVGRFLIVIVGISFNLAISINQILTSINEKYAVFFKSIQSHSRFHIFRFCLPFVLEKLIPTLRFSLSTAIGLVVISEMLGSQVGLGYLIQTARSTFSLNVIFLATIFFGLVNFITDFLLLKIWKRLIFWQK